MSKSKRPPKGLSEAYIGGTTLKELQWRVTAEMQTTETSQKFWRCSSRGDVARCLREFRGEVLRYRVTCAVPGRRWLLHYSSDPDKPGYAIAYEGD